MTKARYTPRPGRDTGHLTLTNEHGHGLALQGTPDELRAFLASALAVLPATGPGDACSSTGDGCTCGWRCDLDGEAYSAAYLAHEPLTQTRPDDREDHMDQSEALRYASNILRTLSAQADEQALHAEPLLYAARALDQVREGDEAMVADAAHHGS